MTTPPPLSRRGLQETSALIAEVAYRYATALEEAKDLRKILDTSRANPDDVACEKALLEGVIARLEWQYAATMTVARGHNDLDTLVLTGALARTVREGGEGAAQAGDVLDGEEEVAARMLVLTRKIRGERPAPSVLPVHLLVGQPDTEDTACGIERNAPSVIRNASRNRQLVTCTGCLFPASTPAPAAAGFFGKGKGRRW